MVKTLLLTLMLAAFATPSKLSADANNVTFTIWNQQPAAVGQVTINTLTSTYYINVTDQTTYTIDIDANAISATIAGQVVPAGQKALVTLADGTVVGILWPTTNGFAIVDKDEIQ